MLQNHDVVKSDVVKSDSCKISKLKRIIQKLTVTTIILSI